jgi:hypothetical protein
MRKIVILCIASVLLMSCVGIDSKVTIKDDGSGTLLLNYRVSQLVADLGTTSSEKGVVPLPLAKTDFERSLQATQGKVRLTKFERTENEKDISIRVELSFDSLDALAQIDAFHDAELKLSADGARHTFSQLIAHAPAQPVTEDSLRMIDAFFDGYDLTFVIEAPQPIKDFTLGSLSADKRVLTYTTSIKEVVRTQSDLVLSAGW